MSIKTIPKKKPAKRKARKKKIAFAGGFLSVKSAVALAVSVVLVISVLSVFAVAKSHAVRKSALVKPDKEIACGIDVSAHNGKVNWHEVVQEMDFAFIRVGCRGYSRGEINADKQYKYNLKKANKAGIPVGVYIYSQAVNEAEAEEEAEFVLSRIKGYDVSLPVVIDFEYAFKDGERVGRLSEARLGKNEITSLMNAFCNKVKNAGYTPAIYASSYIFQSHVNIKDISKDVYIWVADYNKAVTYSGFYDFWQYTEKGTCKGVKSKYVDLNYWYVSNRE